MRAAGVLALGGALFLAWVVLGPRVSPAPHTPAQPYAAVAALLALLVSALLVARLPRHGVTRIVAASTLCYLAGFGLDPIASALRDGPLSTVVRWAAGVAWAGTLPLSCCC